MTDEDCFGSYVKNWIPIGTVEGEKTLCNWRKNDDGQIIAISAFISDANEAVNYVPKKIVTIPDRLRKLGGGLKRADTCKELFTTILSCIKSSEVPFFVDDMKNHRNIHMLDMESIPFSFCNLYILAFICKFCGLPNEWKERSSAQQLE